MKTPEQITAGGLFDLVRVADGKVLVRADRETVDRVASLFTRGGFEVREAA